MTGIIKGNKGVPKESPSDLIEKITNIICDKELTPDVCSDSGQVEWSLGEARKLAKAIVEVLREECRDKSEPPTPLTELVDLRPTDDEIALEARQVAQEMGWTPMLCNIWEQGARWARGMRNTPA